MITFTIAILLFTFISALALLYATRHTKLDFFTRLVPALLPSIVVWLVQVTRDGAYTAAAGVLLYLLGCLFLSGTCLRALRWRRTRAKPPRYTGELDHAAMWLADALRDEQRDPLDTRNARRRVTSQATRDVLEVRLPEPLPPRLLLCARNYALAFVDHKLYGEVDHRTERLLQSTIDDLYHAARECAAEANAAPAH